jgi:hypothetical protein
MYPLILAEKPSCSWHRGCYIDSHPGDRLAPSYHLTPPERAPDPKVSVWKEVQSPMLPPFIIEQIRRREDDFRRRYEQPQLELPLPSNMPRPAAPDKSDDDDPGGVVIIDL